MKFCLVFERADLGSDLERALRVLQPDPFREYRHEVAFSPRKGKRKARQVGSTFLCNWYSAQEESRRRRSVGRGHADSHLGDRLVECNEVAVSSRDGKQDCVRPGASLDLGGQNVRPGRDGIVAGLGRGCQSVADCQRAELDGRKFERRVVEKAHLGASPQELAGRKQKEERQEKEQYEHP